MISGQIELQERRTTTIGANGFGSGYRAEAIGTRFFVLFSPIPYY